MYNAGSLTHTVHTHIRVHIFAHVHTHTHMHTHTDNDCLNLCSSLLSLLQVMVQKLTPPSVELVFSTLQLNWRSFIGEKFTSSVHNKCILNLSTDLLLYTFKLDPYLQSLLYWDLRMHALTLFNSLLVHCFQPLDSHTPHEAKHPPNEYTAHKALVGNMTNLLDSMKVDDRVRICISMSVMVDLCVHALESLVW